MRYVVAILALVGLLAGCSSSSGNGGQGRPLRARMLAWWPNVKPDLVLVQQDEARLGHAAQLGVLGTERTCRQLKIDVQSLQTDPPSPDPVFRRDLRQAMGSYSTAASLCMAGRFSAAGQANRVGTKWINRASARISQLQ